MLVIAAILAVFVYGMIAGGGWIVNGAFALAGSIPGNNGPNVQSRSVLK